MKRISLALLLAVTVGVVVTVVRAQTAVRLWAITTAQLAAGATTGLPLLCTASGSGCALQVAISGALANAQTVAVGTGTATATVIGTLTTNTTSGCTTAVITEETLWTYSLPANTLATDGRVVRITVFGTTGVTANAKTMKVYFGATLLQNYNAGTANNLNWRFEGTVFRTGATAQVGSGNMIVGANHLNNILAVPAETLSGAVVIKMTGQNGVASANDICFRGALVEAL